MFLYRKIKEYIRKININIILSVFIVILSYIIFTFYKETQLMIFGIAIFTFHFLVFPFLENESLTVSQSLSNKSNISYEFINNLIYYYSIFSFFAVSLITIINTIIPIFLFSLIEVESSILKIILFIVFFIAMLLTVTTAIVGYLIVGFFFHDIAYSSILIYLLLRILTNLDRQDELRKIYVIFFGIIYLYITKGILIQLSGNIESFESLSNNMNFNFFKETLVQSGKIDINKFISFYDKIIFLFLTIKDFYIFYISSIVLFNKEKSDLKDNLMTLNKFILVNLTIIALLFIIKEESYKNYINILFILTLILFSIKTFIETVNIKSLFKIDNYLKLISLFLVPIGTIMYSFFKLDELFVTLPLTILMLMMKNNYTSLSKLEKTMKTLTLLFLIGLIILFIVEGYLDKNIAIFFISMIVKSIYNIYINNIENDCFIQKWKRELTNPEIKFYKKYELNNEHEINKIIFKLNNILYDNEAGNIKISKKFKIKIINLLEYIADNYFILKDYDNNFIKMENKKN